MPHIKLIYFSQISGKLSKYMTLEVIVSCYSVLGSGVLIVLIPPPNLKSGWTSSARGHHGVGTGRPGYNVQRIKFS